MDHICPQSLLKTIEKPSQDWDGNNKQEHSVGTKAMYILYCGLDAEELNRISCESMLKIYEIL